MAKYGKKAQDKVERSMHEMKKGKLRSGRSGKKVTNPKQAIAIGLSEARKAGGKVPSKGTKSAAKKTGRKRAAKKAPAKRAAAKKSPAKRSPAKKSTSRKTARKSAAKKSPAKRSVRKPGPKKGSK
jgi:hypothetical protein